MRMNGRVAITYLSTRSCSSLEFKIVELSNDLEERQFEPGTRALRKAISNFIRREDAGWR